MADGNIHPDLSAAIVARVQRPTERTIYEADGLVIKHHTTPQFCTRGFIDSVTINQDGTEIELVGSDVTEVFAALKRLVVGVG